MGVVGTFGEVHEFLVNVELSSRILDQCSLWFSPILNSNRYSYRYFKKDNICFFCIFLSKLFRYFPLFVN